MQISVSIPSVNLILRSDKAILGNLCINVKILRISPKTRSFLTGEGSLFKRSLWMDSWRSLNHCYIWLTLRFQMSQYPELLSGAMWKHLISGMLSLTFPQNFRRVKIVFFWVSSWFQFCFWHFFCCWGAWTTEMSPFSWWKITYRYSSWYN